MLARVARRVQRSTPRRAFSAATGGTSATEDRTESLYFTTRGHIKGREVLEEFGMVSAVAVRSKSVISDMYVALAGLVGGEAASYTSLMNETMAEAVHRVEYAARAQGATAVINVRFDSNTTMNRLVFGMHCSVICYGTAVRCRPLPPVTNITL
ncbi:hypothetical protein F444_06334 [Phytophthora nicotianae P1976]|uniref:Uncharacterized protein n=1 Tax=Phytophthora nicotianae P1976 TaxID=1317066 RepID=A0A081AIW8_PHYNI|nr:hypothetical protein F444_06334 [Phytophthora nicotianae P1976]